MFVFRHLSQQRGDHNFQRFNLGGVADQQSGALPLGLRQRLSLAVAVLHRPEVLILDEPTSGVDPAARDDFWRLLIELSREPVERTMQGDLALGALGGELWLDWVIAKLLLDEALRAFEP